MKPSMKRSCRLLVAVVAFATGSFAGSAFAEDGPLSKAEVEAIAASKKMAYVRDTDQKKIEFSLNDGHSNYALSTPGGRNITMGGTYEITDSGQLCFKWQADKYVNLPDGCYAFRHEGDKVLVAGGKNPTGRLGELVK
jgi:hypothetical protein